MAYLGWLGPLQEAGDTPTAVLPHGPVPQAGPWGMESAK